MTPIEERIAEIEAGRGRIPCGSSGNRVFISEDKFTFLLSKLRKAVDLIQRAFDIAGNVDPEGTTEFREAAAAFLKGDSSNET